MVINHLDKLFVTSDAATIIRELEVVHPAGKVLVMASQQQEHEVRLPFLWGTLDELLEVPWTGCEMRPTGFGQEGWGRIRESPKRAPTHSFFGNL